MWYITYLLQSILQTRWNIVVRLNLDVVKTYRSITYAKGLLEKVSVPKLVYYWCCSYLQAVKDVMFNSSSDYMECVYTIGPDRGYQR